MKRLKKLKPEAFVGGFLESIPSPHEIDHLKAHGHFAFLIKDLDKRPDDAAIRLGLRNPRFENRHLDCIRSPGKTGFSQRIASHPGEPKLATFDR